MRYNTTHPELRKEEKFLGNVNEEGFRRIGWTTKRRGEVAYDIYGNIIKSDLFPVFVQKEEYNTGMKILHIGVTK